MTTRDDVAAWAIRAGWTLTNHTSNTGERALRFAEWQKGDMVVVVHYDGLERVARGELYRMKERDRVQIQQLRSRSAAKLMKVLTWLDSENEPPATKSVKKVLPSL